MRNVSRIHSHCLLIGIISLTLKAQGFGFASYGTTQIKSVNHLYEYNPYRRKSVRPPSSCSSVGKRFGGQTTVEQGCSHLILQMQGDGNVESYHKNLTRLQSSKDNKIDGPSPQITMQSLPGAKFIDDFFARPRTEVNVEGMVLLFTLLVALTTVSTLPSQILDLCFLGEDIISFVFVVEFFARWYGQNLSFKHLLNPFSLIDLLVISPLLIQSLPPFMLAYIPTFLSPSSGLINLKLLRVLRFQRVLTDLETFRTYEMELGLKASDVRPYQLQLARIIISLFTLLSVASGLIYTAEHTVNPEGFPDYFTALYFGLTTLTTVGFGDITPVTFQGRLVVMGSIIVGVAVIPAQAASLVEALLIFQKEKEVKRNGNLSEMDDNFDYQREFTTVTKDEWAPLVQDSSFLQQQTDNNPNVIPTTYVVNEACRNCNAFPHRLDARFCWSCGNQLASMNKERNGNESSRLEWN